MTTPWVENIHLISDGQQVKGSTPNRALIELYQRTQYLKEMLEQMETGRALIRRDVSLSSNTKEGYAVYYDAAEEQYKPAIAEVVYDSSLGYYVAAETMYVAGIVLSKSTPTTGDLLLIGLDNSIDFTDAYGSSILDAGAYYLSTSNPGMLTTIRPPVSALVLYSYGNGYIQVNPNLRDILETHVHLKFDLYTEPAGEVSLVDGIYTFTSIDDSRTGWLPADHAIFNNTAPEGAVLGYNLQKHGELNNIFPPIPLDSACIERDGIVLSTTTENKLVSIDENGIWWYSLCEGQAPWSDNSDSSSSSSLACPTDVDHTLTLWFTRMVFKTDSALVTSLAPADGSPIVITDCNGNNANHGSLRLGLSMDNIVTDEDLEGYQVIKDIVNNKFVRGPVVSAIKAASGYVVVGGTKYLGDDKYAGEIEIDVSIPGLDTRDGSADLVNLDNVREDVYDDILFLTFPSGMESTLIAKVNLPGGLPSNAGIRLKLWVLARAAGVLPTLTAEWRKLSYSSSPVSLFSTSYSSFYAFDLSTFGSLNADEYVVVESDMQAVNDNDIVYFKISRGSDSYAGDIGLLRFSFSIGVMT